jgi:protease II
MTETMNESGIPAPPTARKEHTETEMHGVLLSDDYAWLRDKENPDVTAYLEAENAYADAVMAPLAGLREELYQEMLSHVKQTDISVSYRDGDWWYYSRTEEGLQYGIFCRKRGGPAGPDADAAEEIVLDGNALAKGHAFFAIGDTDITDDGRWLAYSTDTTGFRQYTLRIKDLETGETLTDEVERVGSVVWAADNRTLFYTVEDEQQKRQYQLFRGSAGQLSEAVLVYQEDDERFNIAAGRTRDGKYIVLESASHTTSEARVLKADDPTGAFRTIAPREDEHEYSLDHRNGVWFIRTNDRGRNFRLVTAPVETPEREHWTELIAHREAIMLEDVDLFAEFFIACEREDGLPRLRLWKFAGAESGFGSEAALSGEIAFPEPAYSAHPHVNRIFETTTFRYGYQSLVTPNSVYEYDTASGASSLLKQLEIPGGFDRTLYASERIHATAPDGVAVPVSIVYRKDKRTVPPVPAGRGITLQEQQEVSGHDFKDEQPVTRDSAGREKTPQDQQEVSGHDFSRAETAAKSARALAPAGVSRPALNPLYVYGYGSYGYSLPLGFSSNRLSLLDRGVVMAYAHIRGGGDLGKPWHDAGKMLVKRNTFTDFIACVEHLTAAGYGDPNRVAIEGGSAGGLLMGAVANMRPEIFRAVLSHVPFVDVMNTMLDSSLPLTVPEYEEWGDPNQEEFFRYMLSYSPYDNLRAASYPAMLVKTSLHDSQVMYWEPAKYVAKLRTLKTDNYPLLLVTNMQAGHGGASGRYDYLKEIALDYAFVLRELGIV